MKVLIQHNQNTNDISGVFSYIKAIEIGFKLKEIKVRIIATKNYNFNYYVKNLIWADIVHLNSNHLILALLAKILAKKVIIKYHYPIYESNHFQSKQTTFFEQIRTEIIDSIPKANYPLIYKIYPIVRWARLCKRLTTALLADRHIAASQALNRSCPLPWKVLTIHNPIEISTEFTPKKLSDLYYPYTFVFAGRLHQDKGVDILIRAMKALLECRQDFQVLIIGNGSYFDRLKSLALELDVLNHINFFGKLPHEKVLIKIKQSLALVYPSRWQEPVGYTVIEASSVQTCSIVSKMGALPEVASPSSFFFENEEITTLTNHLNCCLDNPEEVLERGLEARKYVAQKFALNNSINQLLAYCSDNY